jgi:hypothetical protein
MLLAIMESHSECLPRVTKSRLTSRNWPGPGTAIAVIWCHRQVSLLNLKRGFDETNYIFTPSQCCGYKMIFFESGSDFSDYF